MPPFQPSLRAFSFQASLDQYLQPSPATPPHLNLFPQVLGGVRALDGLDVQVAYAVMFADGGVAGVRQGAGALVAEPGHVVLVPARKDEVGARN